jgi:hypothetical protein
MSIEENKINVFRNNLNPYFIETGACEGMGIKAALTAGFNSIISIELLQSSYDYCSSIFRNNPQVKLILGDSAFLLLDVILKINDKITFWLDGHSSGGSPKGFVSSPLMYELDQIKKHPIKTHTILIDDLRSWSKGNPEIGFDTSDLKEKILEINDQYKFYLADGYCAQDILVAYIDKEGK